MKKAVTDPMPSRRDFQRRASERLAELQKTLLPDHAAEVIAINVDTGEYVLAPTSGEAWKEFRRRWAGTLGYVCRVDGSASTKFYGK